MGIVYPKGTDFVGDIASKQIEQIPRFGRDDASVVMTREAGSSPGVPPGSE